MKMTAIICLLGYFFIGLFVNHAYASEFSVGMYPPLLKIDAGTEAEISAPFSIQNQSKTDPIELTFEIVPFVPSQKFDGQISLVPKNTIFSQKYVSLFHNSAIMDGDEKITSLSLAPLQQKQLALSIRLPKDQDNGDYYFTILASSKPTSLDQSTVSSIIGQIGINVLLSVGDKQAPQGIIQDFSTPFFLFQGPVPINLLVENTTANAFAPTGIVVIKNMFDQTVGNVTLLPVNILAHASRFIPDDTSHTKTQIIWPEKHLLGFYKAQVTLSLSPHGPVFSRTVLFFAAPIGFVIAFAVIVFALTYILLRIVEKLKSQE